MLSIGKRGCVHDFFVAFTEIVQGIKSARKRNFGDRLIRFRQELVGFLDSVIVQIITERKAGMLLEQSAKIGRIGIKKLRNAL